MIPLLARWTTLAWSLCDVYGTRDFGPQCSHGRATSLDRTRGSGDKIVRIRAPPQSL